MFEKIKSLWRFAKEDTPEPEDSERRVRPTDQEIAVSGDSTFLSLFADFEQYNPDELVSRKGYDIYYKMLRDDQIKPAYNSLVNIIISRESYFEKQNDEPIQDEIIEFFQHNINSLLIGSWLQALRTIMLGKAQGFSVSEKVFRVENINGVDRWIISKIKKKPYWSFVYKIDEYGNVKEIRQDIGDERKSLNPAKFIIFVNQPELDPIWGESDLRACYRAYWEKDIILRLQSIWIERLAGGFVVANPTEKATNLTSSENADLRKILTNITKSTGIKAPLGYNIEVVQGTDTDAFENAILQKNKAISRALFMPNLLGLSDQKGAGSFAQSKSQLELFLMILKEQGDYLAEILNEQLFSQLAWWNFQVKEYPRFRFMEMTNEQQQKAAEAWIGATKDGAVVNTFDDEKRTRQLLKYPQREESEEDKGNEEDEFRNHACDHKHVDFQEEETESFAKRLDFVEIEKTFDNIEAGFSSDLRKVNNKIFAEFKKRMRTIYRNLPKNKDKIDYDSIAKSFESLPTKKLKSDLNRVFKDNLTFSYKAGRKAGKDSLKEAVIDEPKDVQDRIKVLASTSRQVLCREKEWTVLNFIDGISLEVAENYINAESFMNTKDLTDDEREIVHRTMVEGIKNEKSISQIIDDLDEKIRAKFSDARWETTARTNITNIFTQAQLATYTDPALQDFVAGLEYSAILDDRTTPFCRTYDGRKFKINDPIWSSITPPNHMNCFLPDTDVLTDNGFVPFYNIRGDENFITLNPEDHSFELSKAIRKIERYHKGEIINFKGKNFDLAVTPGHRNVILEKGHIKFKKASACRVGDIIPTKALMTANVLGKINLNSDFPEKISGSVCFDSFKIVDDTIKKIDYDGMVYCVELEKHNILYVRRNGKCTWSGNCRSVLIPITILDEWKPSKPIKSVQPAIGFR